MGHLLITLRSGHKAAFQSGQAHSKGPPATSWRGRQPFGVEWCHGVALAGGAPVEVCPWALTHTHTPDCLGLNLCHEILTELSSDSDWSLGYLDLTSSIWFSILVSNILTFDSIWYYATAALTVEAWYCTFQTFYLHGGVSTWTFLSRTSLHLPLSPCILQNILGHILPPQLPSDLL